MAQSIDFCEDCSEMYDVAFGSCPKCYNNTLQPANVSDNNLNLKDINEAMVMIKPRPADDFKASIVSFKAYNELLKVAAPATALFPMPSCFGLDIIPVAGCPEHEALMFKDRDDAHRFARMVESVGYEEAKKKFKILINIRNLK